LNIHQYNTNCGILDAYRCNNFSKILNALKIWAKEILNVALPKHSTEILDASGINATEILDALEHIPTEILDAPGINATEILDAPGINATEILDALKHTPTKILDAPGINATEILDALKHTSTRILDAFRQNATKILNARSRITQAQTNLVRSQILNAANQTTPRAKLQSDSAQTIP
jgi:hypothetical protein